jgi:bacillithiol synthase
MQCINYPLIQTGQINNLSADYLSGKEEIRYLYQFEPSRAGIKTAIETRQKFPVDRKSLVDALKRQYADSDSGFFTDERNKPVIDNIESLVNENTFTVCTGHQLNIFTGPLYFIYKIISTIKYAALLKEAYPSCHFVPVYWMASEDHDFAEINHLHLWGKTYNWDTEASGSVGKLNPASLKEIISEIEKLLLNNPNGTEIITLFRKAYLEHHTLAAATHFLVNALFNAEGLVVVDGDDAILKKALIPVLEKDLFENSINKVVSNTNTSLGKKYKLPASPREINVFYLEPKSRKRIIFENDQFRLAEGSKTWTPEALKNEVKEHPENFSPNVIMRPMYQELILPNLVYIGGNNEIAYWLELYDAFKAHDVFFPQLLVRDSALIIGKKAAKDLEALKLKPEDLFLGIEDLKFKFYQENMLEHNSEKDAAVLLEQYEKLRTDLQGLPGDLVANIVKQMNLHIKEVRRWKNEIHNKQLEMQEKNVTKLEKLYNAFYPGGEMQERHDNFIPYYLQFGKEWFGDLKRACNPLQAVCHIFVEE